MRPGYDVPTDKFALSATCQWAKALPELAEVLGAVSLPCVGVGDVLLLCLCQRFAAWLFDSIVVCSAVRLFRDRLHQSCILRRFGRQTAFAIERPGTLNTSDVGRRYADTNVPVRKRI
jgi:hypothetical protein